MNLEQLEIGPERWETALIRDLAESVSGISEIGVIQAFKPEQYLRYLLNARKEGAPAELCDALARPPFEGCVLFHGGHKTLLYWQGNGRWLLAGGESGLAGPIWFPEPQMAFAELGRLLEIFLGPDLDAGYLFTEEAQRLNLEGCPEPRPILKRRFFETRGGALILHSRLIDSVTDGTPARTSEYVLAGPGVRGIWRIRQTLSLNDGRTVSKEGPKEIPSVDF